MIYYIIYRDYISEIIYFSSAPTLAIYNNECSLNMIDLKTLCIMKIRYAVAPHQLLVYKVLTKLTEENVKMLCGQDRYLRMCRDAMFSHHSLIKITVVRREPP